MAKKFWTLLYVVILLSATIVHAAENKSKTSGSSGPIFKDPATGMEMVSVKGGCYQMGNVYDDEDLSIYPEEKPVHEVCVDAFYIGKYEVTQGQWKAVMGSNTADLSTCKQDDCPVNMITWDEIQDFIGRLNSRSGGSKYRLPTEAEWEYAAKSGGKRERYSGGDDVDSVAWYVENAKEMLHPVGLKAPNGLGIHDMSGNVWEMTNDWYDSNYYATSPRDNPKGPSSGTAHSIRGGCDGGMKYNQRTSRRKPSNDWGDDRPRVESLGFRLLRTP
jgi:formylglycine-generating enzyme required for sulfatase activity